MAKLLKGWHKKEHEELVAHAAPASVWAKQKLSSSLRKSSI